MIALIDTNVLLASVFIHDQNHVKARKTIQRFQGRRIVVAPVLQAVFFMTAARIHYQRAVNLFEYIQTEDFEIEALTEQDMLRMVSIMKQYKSAGFDYPDVSIMVVAERLDIGTIYTFDRRDFLTCRPAHRDAFMLLP
jgi:predicted nucleic acid-binding protein